MRLIQIPFKTGRELCMALVVLGLQIHSHFFFINKVMLKISFLLSNLMARILFLLFDVSISGFNCPV